MKNEYKYLITYYFDNNVGTAQITTDRVIKSFTDIEDIINYLKEKNKDKDAKNLIITDYNLIRKTQRKRKFIK